jgi:hypothetical protein
MPYAPGIQDISGQLIAQGMSQAGAARARAIESLGESISGGIKQYQQNQMFTQQALGKFGQQLQDPTFKQYVDRVVNDDPNAPQVPDALKKAFKNAAAGKVDIYDAALLGTATEGYQQNQMRQAQTALVNAQANELRNKIARERAVAQMLGLPTGDLPVEPSENRQAPVPSTTFSPASAPQAIQPFMGQSKAEGEAPSAPSNLAAFDPEIAAAARRESALKFLSTGQYSDPTLAAQRIAAEKRKQSAEARQMTLEDAEQAQKEFNEQQAALPFGQRRSASVKESGTGGYYVLNIAPAEMTAIEKQQLEAGTQAEKDRLARIGSVITQDRQVATSERSIAPAVSGLSKLLTEDRLEGSSLAQLKTNIRSFGKALGLPVDESKLTDAQTAIPYFGQLVLPVFNQTKGSISDKETALFQTWSPQLALNKDANLELLSVIDKRMKMSRKLEDLGNKVDAEEIKPTDYVKQRAKLLSEYDASIPSVEEFRQKVGAPSQTISDGVRQTGLNQQAARPASQTAQSLFNKYVR